MPVTARDVLSCDARGFPSWNTQHNHPDCYLIEILATPREQAKVESL
jgi:hypothetical protein